MEEKDDKIGGRVKRQTLEFDVSRRYLKHRNISATMQQ